MKLNPLGLLRKPLNIDAILGASMGQIYLFYAERRKVGHNWLNCPLILDQVMTGNKSILTMRTTLSSILFLLTFSLIAQDTTRIQTLDFSDITKRRGWYEFPDDPENYRKIIMRYTLKCDLATTQDNYACGEWDYTTFTDVYTYDNVGTPYFKLGNQDLDSIPYRNIPGYDYIQSYQYFPVYSNTISENSYDIGNASSVSADAMRTDRVNHRAQYLYTAAELITAGLSAGSIDRLGIDFFGAGGQVDHLMLRLKHSSLTELTEGGPIDNSGFQTVYHLNTDLPALGPYSLNFTEPFMWDGVSNILIDISSRGAADNSMTMISATDSGADRGLVSSQEDRYLDFQGDEYVEVPAEVFADINQEISISFWAYGDEETMPFNSWVLEGVDEMNRRVLNVHLPWSNSRVYWDAGNAMSNNYDRIDMDVSITDLAGKWTHWTFVKNASTGIMAIYMNGTQVLQGTGKTRSMAGVTRFKIGGKADQPFAGNYDGHIDEFQVWSKALTEAEVQAYMYRSINASHPQYPSLEAAYSFDERQGSQAMDSSPAQQHAQLMGLPTRVTEEGSALNRNMVLSSIRPDLTFYSGEYDMTVESVLMTEEVEHDMVSVIHALPYIDQAVAGVSYSYIDTSYVYLPGNSSTYDPEGLLIDETELLATDVFLNSFKANRHQLQNYVTPYGIGLSLGSSGFRWEYEVTDYALILNGLIEVAAGNQQELIDLEFDFIQGTPPRDLLGFETIWLGDYGHADIADDVVLPAVPRTLRADASEFMMRSRSTGHWFGGVNNCAEFCPKTFHIDIDGVERFSWLNWKECSDNPVIDQGGTWIYDRAGWCPGTFADSYDHEMTPYVTPGETYEIDFGMQAYPTGGGEGNYRSTLQLFQYGPKNFQNDVELVDVISPNDWEFHNLYNPICKDPVVSIRNLGAQTLTSATISYNVSGGAVETYAWTGSLDFKEAVEVTLPISGQSFWSGNGEEIFHVNVSLPNGQADENTENSSLSAAFEMPDVYTVPFYIWFKTNLAYGETGYWVYDEAGNEILNRDPTAGYTEYKDTLDLPDGCYTLYFQDTGQDGLSFFANNDGNGFFRTRKVTGAIIKNFNPSFGGFINYHFLVDQSVGIEDELKERFITVFPNPSAEGLFYLNVDAYYGSELNVEVLDAQGRVVMRLSELRIEDMKNIPIDLQMNQKGIYFARIMIDGRQVVKKLIKD